jgi:N-acetylmuramoyl-L-alanine amidase
MSKVIRIISASVMLTVLSAIILAGCGNRHSDKAGLNKSDITETLSQTLESEKDSQMNSRSEENTDTEITDTEAEDSGQVDSEDGSQEETSNPYIIVREPYTGVPVYEDMEHIYMNTTWEYADHSAISDGYAVLYKAAGERKNIIIGVNAGHGTAGGSSVRTLCHPDGSPKSTGGSTGATTATAVSGGMTFYDGTPESEVTFRMAQILRDRLLSQGYDVLMVRDDADVQLDNVARTVICNNVADCHISLHWDGDGLSYDKGCFYIAVPDAIKDMEPVATHWQQHNALGASLVNWLGDVGMKIHGSGSMAIDLTQTSYSTIPSVDMELGNASSDHSDETLENIADGLMAGINAYYGY